MKNNNKDDNYHKAPNDSISIDLAIDAITRQLKSSQELNKVMEKAVELLNAFDKANKMPSLKGQELYEYVFKDCMTYDEYKKHENKAREQNQIDEIKLKSMGIESIKPTLKESTAKKENLVQEAMSKLIKLTAAGEKAKKRPDLDGDQLYEYAFKDVMDKKDYQEVFNETKQEMLKSGYYRRSDPKNRQ